MTFGMTDMRKNKFNEAMDEDRKRQQRENHFTRRRLMWALEESKRNTTGYMTVNNTVGNPQRGRATFLKYKESLNGP